MKTSSAKQKGRKLVVEVKESLLKRFSDLLSEDLYIMPTCVGGEDLKPSPKARQCFPFSVECKNQEKINIHSSLAQCEANAGEYTPLLIFRRNRSKTYVCLAFDDFLDLI